MQQEAARTHPELCSPHSPSAVPRCLSLPQHQGHSTSAPMCPPSQAALCTGGRKKQNSTAWRGPVQSYCYPPPFQLQNILKQTQINRQDKSQSCKKRKRTTQQPSFRGSSAAASPQSKGSPSTSRGRWQLHAVVLICLYPNLLLHGTEQIRTGSGSGSAVIGTTQPRYLQRIASCSWGSPPGWHPAARWPGETGHVRAVGSRSGGALTAHPVPSPSSVPFSSSGATPGGTAAAPGTPARAPGQSCPAGPSAAPGKQCL